MAKNKKSDKGNGILAEIGAVASVEKKKPASKINKMTKGKMKYGR